MNQEEILNRFLDYLASLLDEKLKALSDEDFEKRLRTLEDKLKGLQNEENYLIIFKKFKEIFYEIYGDIITDPQFLENSIIEFFSTFLGIPQDTVKEKLSEILLNENGNNSNNW